MNIYEYWGVFAIHCNEIGSTFECMLFMAGA